MRSSYWNLLFVRATWKASERADLQTLTFVPQSSALTRFHVGPASGKMAHHPLGSRSGTSEMRRHAAHRRRRRLQGLQSYKTSSQQWFVEKQNSLKRRVPTAGYVRAFFTQWLKYNGMFPLICVINQLSFHFHSEKESMMRVVVLGLDYLENI